MRVEQITIPERPLIDAYRYDFPKVQEFYEYDPNDDSSFARRYAYLQTKHYERERLVLALEAYNRQIGVSEKTLVNLKRLRSPETMVVITGQQAGVLSGPLYTIYKALTVLNLASDLSAKGISTVPLFWVASEDHDFPEIAGVHLLNQDQKEVEVRLQAEVNREPIGYLELKSEVQQLLDDFASHTTDTEFKSEIMHLVRDMADESQNLAEWFARIMAWLLQDTGMIFIDSLDENLRELGREFFLQVIEKNAQITLSLADTEARLTEAGYPVQIHKTNDQIHLFMIKDQARYPLDLTTEGYRLRGTEWIYSLSELHNQITRYPASISTNVVTRPLFQDYLLPTIAYVAGPGETAYYAQYKEIYRLFGMEMPIIYPRVSITLVEAAIAKNMNKYNLTPQKVFQEFGEIREQYLAETDELNLTDRFKQIKGLFVPEYQKLIKELTKLDGKFKNLGSQNLQMILEQIAYLEEKAYHQHRKNSEILLRQLEKVKVNLYPGDTFQERRFNIFPYLFKYQHGLINELLELNLLSGNCHYVIYL